MIAYNWTPEKLARLKEAYAAADKRHRDEFKFDGYSFYTGYAKYLIEYLEQEFQMQADEKKGTTP